MDFRKWPDAAHWHFDVRSLGEDAHGRWFLLPEGTAVQKGLEPAIQYPRTSVMLLRENAWWAAFWNTDPDQPFELYVDVATPAVWSRDRVTLVDLDLDVIRRWSGEVEVIDRDEFELHRHALAYPAEIVQGAERAARDLVSSIESGQEPFASLGRAWLDRAFARL